MSENKKYYYFRMKENFFDSDAMIVLENMPDGFLYSNILLKLYVKSLKGNGRVMFTKNIPFDSFTLARVTRHQVGTVEKAMDVLAHLELIEILDNGTIYISDIQNFIGEGSTEGDRKRAYRNQIESEKNLLRSDKCPTDSKRITAKLDKCPSKKEIELDI